MSTIRTFVAVSIVGILSVWNLRISIQSSPHEKLEEQISQLTSQVSVLNSQLQQQQQQQYNLELTTRTKDSWKKNISTIHNNSNTTTNTTNNVPQSTTPQQQHQQQQQLSRLNSNRTLLLYMVSRDDETVRNKLLELQRVLQQHQLWIVWSHENQTTCPFTTTPSSSSSTSFQCIDRYRISRNPTLLSNMCCAQEKAIMWAMHKRDQYDIDYVWFMEDDVHFTDVSELIKVMNNVNSNTDLLSHDDFGPIDPTVTLQQWRRFQQKQQQQNQQQQQQRRQRRRKHDNNDNNNNNNNNSNDDDDSNDKGESYWPPTDLVRKQIGNAFAPQQIEITHGGMTFFRMSHAMLASLHHVFVHKLKRKWAFFEALYPMTAIYSNLTLGNWKTELLSMQQQQQQQQQQQLEQNNNISIPTTTNPTKQKNSVYEFVYRPCFQEFPQPGLYHPVKFRNGIPIQCNCKYC